MGRDEQIEAIADLPILHDVFKWKREPGTTPDWTRYDLAAAVINAITPEGEYEQALYGDGAPVMFNGQPVYIKREVPGE